MSRNNETLKNKMLLREKEKNIILFQLIRDGLAPKPIRVFQKHTKLATLALLPALYTHIYFQFSSLFAPTDVSKYEIRNQEVHADYISRLNALLD